MNSQYRAFCCGDDFSPQPTRCRCASPAGSGLCPGQRDCEITQAPGAIPVDLRMELASHDRLWVRKYACASAIMGVSYDCLTQQRINLRPDGQCLSGAQDIRLYELEPLDGSQLCQRVRRVRIWIAFCRAIYPAVNCRGSPHL